MDIAEFTRHERMALFINMASPNAWQTLGELSPQFQKWISDPTLFPWEFVWERLMELPTFSRRLKALSLYFPPTKELPNTKGLSLTPSNSVKQFWPEPFRILGKYNAELIILNQATDAAAMMYVFNEKNIDDILQIEPGAALLDIEIMKKIFESYMQNMAEYAYSENAPQGFTGKFIHRTIRHHFPPEDLPSVFSLDQIVKKNINNFDIDIHFHPPDIRLTRVSADWSHPLQAEITNRVIQSMPQICNYTQFCEIIQNNPAIGRIHPTYIDIEISKDCQLQCIYCPRSQNTYPKKTTQMDISLFSEILVSASAKQIPYALSFSGMGEPLLHPKFMTFFQIAAQEPLIEKIFLETNGLLLSKELVEQMQNQISPPKQLHIIINLSAMDANQYSEIHGGNQNDFLRLLEIIHSLAEISKANPNLLTLQLLKIKQTEKNIDSYFKHWEEKGFSVLLQKQNTYNGFVPDFRFSDLSPLERFPCWHLLRDLTIHAEGTVPLCKQDLFATRKMGCLATDPIEKIWNQGKDFAHKEAKGDFQDYPACASCDEWYTFNH